MPASVTEEIKNRLNVVEVISQYLRLTKAGVNLKALCPFHKEKTPSFMVSPVRQSWHCFGCNKGGDIFSFVMEMEGVEFADALRTLAAKAGVALKPQDAKAKTERTKLHEILNAAVEFYQNQFFNPEAKDALDYLKSRGLTKESLLEWKLGWAPDSWNALTEELKKRGWSESDLERAGLAVRGREGVYDRFRGRIMFPIFDLHGEPVGFSGRVLKERQNEGKYINTPQTLLYDKSRLLYGLEKAKLEIRKKNEAVFVEGNIDVILAGQDGVKNIVAPCGTALTREHVKTIKRYAEALTFSFDVDEAGASATKRGVDLAIEEGMAVRVAPVPEGKDVADLVYAHPGKLTQVLASSRSIMEYYFDRVLKKWSSETVEGKKEIAKFLLPEIKRIPNSIEIAHWLEELANRLAVPVEAVRQEFAKVEFKTPEIFPEADPSAPSGSLKTRRELLSELLLSILERLPENVSTVAHLEEPFFPAAWQGVWRWLLTQRGNPSKEMAEKLDYLDLRFEFERSLRGEEWDVAAELALLARELEREMLREELGALRDSIGVAERQTPEALPQLLKSFQIKSARLYQLESEPIREQA
ncbi:DNA primase [Candidatus Azambacteria bacterium]|nr:DNA primase [Candidatus Azambacteria bacterium]